MSILVTYASSYGSTQEVAEFIASTLGTQGVKVDLRPIRFPYSLIHALQKMPASDLRDWTAIRTWASSLAEKFQPVVTR